MIVRHTTAHFARLSIASAGTSPAADQVYHARQFGAPVTVSRATLLSRFEACKDGQAVCSYLTAPIDYCTGYMPRTASIALLQLLRPTGAHLHAARTSYTSDTTAGRGSPHCLSEWLTRTDTGFRQSRVMLAVLSIGWGPARRLWRSQAIHSVPSRLAAPAVDCITLINSTVVCSVRRTRVRTHTAWQHDLICDPKGNSTLAALSLPASMFPVRNPYPSSQPPGPRLQTHDCQKLPYHT